MTRSSWGRGSFLYRPGGITPASDLRSLTLRDLAILTRYAELRPDRWLPPLTRYLAEERHDPDRASDRLLASLPPSPVEPESAAAPPAHGRLLQKLGERADAFAPYYPGTDQSTDAESVDALKKRIAKLRSTREALEGYYDISVPEVGVGVPMRLLAPALAALVFLIVTSSVLTARRALAHLSPAQRSDLELESAYDPAWFAPGGSRAAWGTQWVAALAIWFAMPFSGLGLLWFLYGGFRLEPETGRQVAHRVHLVEWRSGRKELVA